MGVTLKLLVYTIVIYISASNTNQTLNSLYFFYIPSPVTDSYSVISQREFYFYFLTVNLVFDWCYTIICFHSEVTLLRSSTAPSARVFKCRRIIFKSFEFLNRIGQASLCALSFRSNSLDHVFKLRNEPPTGSYISETTNKVLKRVKRTQIPLRSPSKCHLIFSHNATEHVSCKIFKMAYLM